MINGAPSEQADPGQPYNRGSTTWIDRIAHAAFGVAGLLSLLALAIGIVLALVLPGLRRFPSVSWWLLIPCVAWDLCSLQIAVRRAVRGHGPSTVPLVAWGYYVLFCLFGVHATWWGRLAALAGLTLFHACCHELVPAITRRHLRR